MHLGHNYIVITFILVINLYDNLKEESYSLVVRKFYYAIHSQRRKRLELKLVVVLFINFLRNGLH